MYRYASPLQIAQYRANYRLNDPKWFQEVASDSSENLQRKSVILLAEINRQLLQNHLDNEKVMATLAILSQQTGDVSSMMLKNQVNEVNNAIKTFTGDANSTDAPPPSSTNSAVNMSYPSTYSSGTPTTTTGN